METVTTEQVQQAVLAMYASNGVSTGGAGVGGAPGGNVQEIQAWLFQAQKQPNAWQIAADLLSTNDTNLQFFGAHTLQVKITRDWNTLDVDAHDSLRDRLLQWMLYFCQGPSVVLRKLCMAVAALALRTVPEEWPDFLPSLFSHFGITAAGPNGSHHPPLAAILELLTILPEEVTRADIAADQRAKISSELVNCFPRVLALLEQCFDQAWGPAPALKQLSLRCLQSWIQFEVPVTSLASIIEKTLRMLPDPNAFQEAIEVLYQLVSHPKSVHFETSICNALLPEITGGWIRQRFQQEFEDEAFVKDICRLLVAFGESFTTFLIQNFLRSDVVGLLQMILQCTGYPGYFASDEEISDMTLNFWYLLQDTLLDEVHLSDEVLLSEAQINGSLDSIRMGSAEDLGASAPRESNAASKREATMLVQQASKQVFLELAGVLRRKACFPDDTEWSHWPIDVQRKFRAYRREIGDALVHCYYILGKDLLVFLTQTFAEISGSQSKSSWQHLESTLLALRSIAEVVPEGEGECMPKIFDVLLRSLPRDHLRIVQTTISLIGAYAPWMSKHDPQYVYQALDFLSPFLLQESTNSVVANEVSASAFRALREISDVCRSALVQSIETFLNLFLNVANISLTNRIELAEAVGRIVQAMPIENQAKSLATIVESISVKLKQSMAVQDPLASRELVMGHLRLINSVLRGLHDDSDAAIPVQRLQHLEAFLGAFWADVLAIAQRWAEDESICQQIDTLLDITITAFKSSQHTQNNLDQGFQYPAWTARYCQIFADLATDAFQRYPQPCWLNSVTTLMNYFGPLAGNAKSSPDYPHFLARHPGCTEEHWQLVKALSEILTNAVCRMTLLSCSPIFEISQLPENVFLSQTEVNLVVVQAMAQRMDARPDMTESLFSLFDMAVSRYAGALFAPPVFTEQSPRLPPNFLVGVFTIAYAGLRMQERMSFKSDIQFLIDLVSLSKASGVSANAPASVKSVVDGIFTSVGFHFIREIILGLAVSVPRTYLHLICDLLFKMVMRYPDACRIWIKSALGLGATTAEDAMLAVPEAAKLPVTVRETFLRQVMTTRSIRAFKEVSKEFALKCRGLQGTAYAGST